MQLQQSMLLVPLLWCDASLRWNGHIKRDPDGPDCLKALHSSRLYDTHLVSSCDFREAARISVVFFDTRSMPGLSYQRTGLLEEICLVELVASQGPLEWARYCHLLWFLWCTSLRESRGRFCRPNLLGTMLRALQRHW